MRKRCAADAGSPVGEAGECDNFHAKRARLHCLMNRAHADCVSADGPKHSDFSGGFVLRAEHRGVNAFVQRHAKCDSVLPELLAGCAAVNLAHINEVWSAEQRRRSCQVDVIRKHHPRAGYKVRVQCTRSIRENETAQSTAVHPTNVRSDFDRGPTFVEMDTPGSDEDDFSAEPAEDKASSVSGNFRMRKSFNFGAL